MDVRGTLATKTDANSVKIDLNINSNIDTILDSMLLALGSVLEAKLAPKSVQNRSSTDLHIGSIFECIFEVGGGGLRAMQVWGESDPV